MTTQVQVYMLSEGILKEDILMLNFMPELKQSDFSSHHEFIFIMDRSGSSSHLLWIFQCGNIFRIICAIFQCKRNCGSQEGGGIQEFSEEVSSTKQIQRTLLDFSQRSYAMLRPVHSELQRCDVANVIVLIKLLRFLMPTLQINH